MNNERSSQLLANTLAQVSFKREHSKGEHNLRDMISLSLFFLLEQVANEEKLLP
jgi:hypothetical protein